jgi:hypothetical protein
LKTVLIGFPIVLLVSIFLVVGGYVYSEIAAQQ